MPCPARIDLVPIVSNSRNASPVALSLGLPVAYREGQEDPRRRFDAKQDAIGAEYVDDKQIDDCGWITRGRREGGKLIFSSATDVLLRSLVCVPALDLESTIAADCQIETREWCCREPTISREE